MWCVCVCMRECVWDVLFAQGKPVPPTKTGYKSIQAWSNIQVTDLVVQAGAHLPAKKKKIENLK